MMKKLKLVLLSSLLSGITLCSFGATLTSLNGAQLKQIFVGHTAVSIPTDNLNGKTIANTFSMFMDSTGHIWGKMAIKPVNEPQSDEGSYTILKDGTVYLIWQHWDGAKKLCFRSFPTKNSYLNIGCDGVFHTAFMKTAITPGNSVVN